MEKIVLTIKYGPNKNGPGIDYRELLSVKTVEGDFTPKWLDIKTGEEVDVSKCVLSKKSVIRVDLLSTIRKRWDESSPALIDINSKVKTILRERRLEKLLDGNSNN